LILFNYREQLFESRYAPLRALPDLRPARRSAGLRLLIKCPHLSVVSFVKDRGYRPATTKGHLRREMRQHRNEIMRGQKKAVKLRS
jgi:hypothetical protein